MYKLVIKPQAADILKEAYKWYEERQLGLGDRLVAEIFKYYDLLESNALLYRKVRRNYRELVCNTFPYIIIYEVVENEVIVYSVFHTSQSPRKKFKFTK